MAHGLDGFFLIFLIWILLDLKKKISENQSHPSNLCAIKSNKIKIRKIRKIRPICVPLYDANLKK